MVLTSFECWAHGGSNDVSLAFGESFIERRSNAVDLFNPTLLRSCNNTIESVQKPVSHLSSNGYYGFAQICNLNVDTDDKKQHDVNISQVAHIPSPQLEEFMDIEQQQLGALMPTGTHIKSSNVTYDLPELGVRNGCKIRRKRGFEQPGIDAGARHGKRYRHQNESDLIGEMNDGACDKTMDHEDIPHVTNLASVFGGIQSNNQQEQSFAMANIDEPSKKCQSRRNKYERIPFLSSFNVENTQENHNQSKTCIQEQGDTRENKNVKKSLLNTNDKIGNDNTCKESYDNQLETLFSTLHGGNSFHVHKFLQNH